MAAAVLHESETFIRFTQAGANLFAWPIIPPTLVRFTQAGADLLSHFMDRRPISPACVNLRSCPAFRAADATASAWGCGPATATTGAAGFGESPRPPCATGTARSSSTVRPCCSASTAGRTSTDCIPLSLPRGRVLRLRYPGQRWRRSPQAAAIDAQDQPCATSGAPCRRHLLVRLQAGRDRSRSIPPSCLSDGTGGHGLEAPRERLPRRQVPRWIKVKNRQHPAFARVRDQFG